MSKRVTIAQALKEKALAIEQNRNLVEKNYQLEKSLQQSEENISSLKAEIQSKRGDFNHVLGRISEIIVQYETLLRTSLRKEGMAWEDIERAICESRRNFSYNDGGDTALGKIVGKINRHF